MRALTCLALLATSSALAYAGPPKPITDAIAALEKALIDSKEPEERAKLRDAIEALKKVSESPKVMNNQMSKFVDSPQDFKGRVVCFQVTYENKANTDNLDKRVGGRDPVAFMGKDPNNGAELLLWAKIPAGLKVPVAKHGESVVVTFKCDGSTFKGNEVVSITRP